MLLPMTIEDVSADWLTHALGQRYPGAIVRSVRIGNVRGGAASKIQLHLDYAPSSASAGLPETMVLKMCTAEGPMGLMSAGLYHREAFFYDQIRDRYDIRVPRFYYAAGQHDPDQALILLEDLARPDIRFGSALRPYSIDEVASALEALAEVHARSMVDPKIHELGLPVTMNDSTVIFDTMVRDADTLFAARRAFAVPVILHDKTKLGKALGLYRAIVKSIDNCLVHGDAHVGNTYCSDGVVSWLDWQMAGRGHWIHDVVYFMIAALDVPDRRTNDRRLLKHYADVARLNGADMPSDEEIWRLYRAAAFYGFITWLGTEVAYQPEEICIACIGRFGSAMLDLETYKALGVD